MKKQLLVIILLACMGCNKAHNPFLHVRNPIEGTNTLHNPIVQSSSIKEPSVPIIESDQPSSYGFIKGTAIIATMYAGLQVIKYLHCKKRREQITQMLVDEYNDFVAEQYAQDSAELHDALQQGKWTHWSFPINEVFLNLPEETRIDYCQSCIDDFDNWFKDYSEEQANNRQRA
jgi:hypothetical protein